LVALLLCCVFVCAQLLGSLLFSNARRSMLRHMEWPAVASKHVATFGRADWRGALPRIGGYKPEHSPSFHDGGTDSDNSALRGGM